MFRSCSLLTRLIYRDVSVKWQALSASCLSTTSVRLYGKKVKPSSTLDRWFNRERKRKKWHVTPMSEAISSQTRKNGLSEGAIRRANHLSLLFREQVLNLISSGELDDTLVETSFDITKVMVVPDLCSINVYWIAPEKSSQNLQEMLDARAPKLRSLLQSCQIMSQVPPVCFVRDLQYSRIKEIDELLAIADYGTHPNEELSKNSEVERHYQSDVAQSSSDSSLEGNSTDSAYGLDHKALMSKVQKLRKQRRQNFRDRSSH